MSKIVYLADRRPMVRDSLGREWPEMPKAYREVWQPGPTRRRSRNWFYVHCLIEGLVIGAFIALVALIASNIHTY